MRALWKFCSREQKSGASSFSAASSGYFYADLLSVSFPLSLTSAPLFILHSMTCQVCAAEKLRRPAQIGPWFTSSQLSLTSTLISPSARKCAVLFPRSIQPEIKWCNEKLLSGGALFKISIAAFVCALQALLILAHFMRRWSAHHPIKMRARCDVFHLHDISEFSKPRLFFHPTQSEGILTAPDHYQAQIYILQNGSWHIVAADKMLWASFFCHLQIELQRYQKIAMQFA